MFVDVETGGLNPRRHSLLQIGAVAYKNGIQDQLILNLSLDEYTTTPEALKVNCLDLAWLKEHGLPPVKAMETFLDFLTRNFGNEKPILVGHNIAFDKAFLEQFFCSQGRDFKAYVSHRMLDTMSILWGLHFAGKIPAEACSSSGAFKYFGCEPERPHDALEDCLATVRLFEKLVNYIGG
jgi:DNA polymerase III epsilon subunit-like protein